MKILSKEEYIAYYEKTGKCIDDISKPNKPLNEKRLNGKYDHYVIKNERSANRRKDKQAKTSDEWDELKSKVLLRDGPDCQIMRMIKKEFGLTTYSNIMQKAGVKMFNQIDLMHIFPRSTYPDLKFDPDNCIFGNRYCHSLLDEFKSPITEDNITLEERLQFFMLLLPEDRIKRLEEKTGKQLSFKQ